MRKIRKHLYSFFPSDLFSWFLQNFQSYGFWLFDFSRVLVISSISQLHSRISSTCLSLQKVNGRGRDANVKLISENVRKTKKFVARIRRIYLANTRLRKQFRNLLERNDFGETFQKVVKLANHEEPLTWHPSRQHCQNHTSLLAVDVHQVRVCREFLRAMYSLTRCNFIVLKTNNFNTFVGEVLTGLVRSGIYIPRSKLFVGRCANTFHGSEYIYIFT